MACGLPDAPVRCRRRRYDAGRRRAFYGRCRVCAKALILAVCGGEAPRAFGGARAIGASTAGLHPSIDVSAMSVSACPADSPASFAAAARVSTGARQSFASAIRRRKPRAPAALRRGAGRQRGDRTVVALDEPAGLARPSRTAAARRTGLAEAPQHAVRSGAGRAAARARAHRIQRDQSGARRRLAFRRHAGRFLSRLAESRGGRSASFFAAERAARRNSGMSTAISRRTTACGKCAERTRGNVLARMALVPRTLEARGLDASPPIRKRLAQAGDHASAAILDVILRDEIGHVLIGNRWFRHLCDAAGADPHRHLRAPCRAVSRAETAWAVQLRSAPRRRFRRSGTARAGRRPATAESISKTSFARWLYNRTIIPFWIDAVA